MTHTWTNMKVNKQVWFSTNEIKTCVTAQTMEGEMTLTVSELKRKVQDRDILPVVRQIFQDMLDYWESVK